MSGVFKGKYGSKPMQRTDSRFAPSQWDMARCKDVSHWLGASLKSALYACKVTVWTSNDVNVGMVLPDLTH